MRNRRGQRSVHREEGRKIHGPNRQPASYPAKLAVRGRREGDADDESLVRSKWEQEKEEEAKAIRRYYAKRLDVGTR